MQSLIDELYTYEECSSIRELFLNDESLKTLILHAIGDKLIIDKHKILTSNPLDIIFMICLLSKFATSEDECHRVALAVYHGLQNTKNCIPRISEDFGLKLSTKTLIALSFFFPALERQWKFHGAPSPSFYRNVSKSVFKTYGQNDLAENHEKWESFLGEFFV
jgi:hypothetical protein